MRACRARAQMMEFGEAERDCDAALARERTAKTLLRRGTARRGQRDLPGARRDFADALALEPRNKCGPRPAHPPQHAPHLGGQNPKIPGVEEEWIRGDAWPVLPCRATCSLAYMVLQPSEISTAGTRLQCR
jgi:hypothetical protein